MQNNGIITVQSRAYARQRPPASRPGPAQAGPRRGRRICCSGSSSPPAQADSSPPARGLMAAAAPRRGCGGVGPGGQPEMRAIPPRCSRPDVSESPWSKSNM